MLWVICDASSVIQKAWWSILKQNLYRRWDLVLPQHPREQAWIYDFEASSLTGQKEVQDSAVSWESDEYCFLCCLCTSSGWFDTSQFSNKCSCISGNSEETQGGYLAEETRMLTKGVLTLQYSAHPHSAAATVNFFNPWGWEVFPHPPSRPDLLCWTSVCSQRWKSTSEVSASTHWICSKWSQELVMCLVHNIVYEELDKLVCHYDMCLNRLCDCVG